MENEIYELMEKIGIIDAVKNKNYLKIHNEPFEPLFIEKLHEENGKVIIAMTHYFEQKRDLIPDPDMEIEIDLENKKARALRFENQFIRQSAYVSRKMEEKLNNFLILWLINIKEQMEM